VEEHGDALATRVGVRGVCRKCSRKASAVDTRHRKDPSSGKKDRAKEKAHVE
jgi:hypothetical protein